MEAHGQVVGRGGRVGWAQLDLLAAGGLVAAAAAIGASEHAPVATVLGFVGCGASIAARRRWPPLACIAVLAFAFVAHVAVGHTGNLLSGVGAAATLLDYYTLGSAFGGAGGRARTLFVGLTVLPITGAGLWRNGAVDGLTSWLLFVALPAVAGWAVSTRGALARALGEENACLDREQRDRIAWLAGNERVQVARELHDIVGHSVSVMVIQAAGARNAVRRNPDAARQALETVQKCGREGLLEIQRLVGVLRRTDGSEELGILPGLDQVATLVERVGAAGRPVELAVEGEAHPLAPGADLAAYRVVQEALTNVVKHAGPAGASVRIAYGESRVEVEVVDDGRPPDPASSVPRGRGLSGMQERVRLYGGDMTAGRRADGRGFRVWACIPFDPTVVPA